MLALFSSVMETLCTSCESVFKKRRPVSSAFSLSELFLPTLSDLMLLQCAVIMAHLLASYNHVPHVQRNHKFIIFLRIYLRSGQYQ